MALRSCATLLRRYQAQAPGGRRRASALSTVPQLPRTRPGTAQYALAAYQFRIDFFNEDTDFGAFSRSASAPRVETVEVPEDRDGQRIDNFLAGRLKGVPKSLIYRLLRTGQVRVNGKRAKPDLRIAAGRRRPDSAGPDRRARATRGRLRPARLPASRRRSCTRTAISSSSTSRPASPATAAAASASARSSCCARRGRSDTLELAHRLDRDTSGVLVLARKRSALTALQEEIREGRVEKRYLACCRASAAAAIDGRCAAAQVGAAGRRAHGAGRRRRQAVALAISAKSSATRWRRLVEVAIETGRTHQIRVHAAHVGPSARRRREIRRRRNSSAKMREIGLKRMFLHAARFEFSIGETVVRIQCAVAERVEAGAGCVGQEVASAELVTPRFVTTCPLSRLRERAGVREGSSWRS